MESSRLQPGAGTTSGLRGQIAAQQRGLLRCSASSPRREGGAERDPGFASDDGAASCLWARHMCCAPTRHGLSVEHFYYQRLSQRLRGHDTNCIKKPTRTPFRGRRGRRISASFAFVARTTGHLF